MQRLKKAIIMGLTVMLCGGGMISTAGAVRPLATADTVYTAETTDTTVIQMVNQIVLFYEGVTPEEKNQYVSGWEPFGVSLVMDLPFINGMVLRVPDAITAAHLADDGRVASVEDSTQPVTLQALTAAADGGSADGGSADGGSADGGSADGGSTSFITPIEDLPNEDRPWGTLNLYDHAYDPWALTSVYDYMSLNEIITDALFSEHMYTIRVAIFDTGVDISHQRLRKQIAGGIDLVNFTEGIPTDDNGHGTHVAGSLCGKNLGSLHYVPVQLFVVKVLDENAIGDVATLAMGLQWAIDNQMDIINMSVAYSEDSPALRLAVQKAHEAGIILVAAAGNHSNWDDPAPTASADGGSADGGSADGGSADGGSANGKSTSTSLYPVMYPAAYPEVIAVGAVDAFEAMAAFSNTGPEVDLLAPGTNIASTDMGGGYGMCSGTSMAVPHVTGAVAMMLSRARDLNKTLTPLDAETILKQTAVDGTINLIGALEDVVYALP
jgi:subtilisin family serine protease